MTIASARRMSLPEYLLSTPLTIGLLVLVVAILLVVIQMRRRTAQAEREAALKTKAG